MKVNLKSPFTRVALRILPIFIAAFLLLSLRWMEYTFMPVVKDFHLTSIERAGGYVIMQGYMRKVRNCKYVGISVEGLTPSGHVDLPLRFLDANIVNDNTTRPQGTQNWGPWKVIIPASPNILALDFHSIHSCHLAWETTTELATVPLVAAKMRDE